MPLLQVELPADVTSDEARLSLALKLFEQRRVPLAIAAKMAGRSVDEFMTMVEPVTLARAEDDLLVAGSVAATVSGALPVEDFSDWKRC